MTKASIIIPVFNSENTLRRCLESILNKTYKEYEVILINDGSTDNSQKLLDEYVKKYPNKIKSYTQVNSGAATARNKGLKLSNSDYLFFIDNDDYIENDYIETFITAIEATTSDLVIGGYKRVDENGKTLYERKASNNLWTKYMIVTPWARVYKKSALINNNLHFLDMNIGEDVWLNIMANLRLKVSTINYTGYNWVDNKTSTSNTLHKGFNKKVDFLPLLKKIQNDTKKLKIQTDEKELLEYFFIKTSIYYILHSGKGVQYNFLKIESKKIFHYLKGIFPQYSRNKHLGFLTPKGEYLPTRAIVSIYILLQKLHLENIFLWVYSKF